MTIFKDKRPGFGLAVDLAVATAAAVAIAVGGVPELAWMPYFFVAALSKRPAGFLVRLKGARP